MNFPLIISHLIKCKIKSWRESEQLRVIVVEVLTVKNLKFEKIQTKFFEDVENTLREFKQVKKKLDPLDEKKGKARWPILKP